MEEKYNKFYYCIFVCKYPRNDHKKVLFRYLKRMISSVMFNIKSKVKNYLSKATDETFSITRLVCYDKTVQNEERNKI